MSIEYYVEEEPDVNNNMDNTETQLVERCNMDANTLLLIASGGVRLTATGHKVF